MKSWKKSRRQRHKRRRARLWKVSVEGRFVRYTRRHRHRIKLLLSLLRQAVERHPELIAPCPKCHDLGLRMPTEAERTLLPAHHDRWCTYHRNYQSIFCDCLIGEQRQIGYRTAYPRWNEGLRTYHDRSKALVVIT